MINPKIKNEKIARESNTLEIIKERFNPNFWENELGCGGYNENC